MNNIDYDLIKLTEFYSKENNSCFKDNYNFVDSKVLSDVYDHLIEFQEDINLENYIKRILSFNYITKSDDIEFEILLENFEIEQIVSLFKKRSVFAKFLLKNYYDMAYLKFSEDKNKNLEFKELEDKAKKKNDYVLKKLDYKFNGEVFIDYLMSINDKFRFLIGDVYRTAISTGNPQRESISYVKCLLVDNNDIFGLVPVYFKDINEFRSYKNYFLRLMQADVYEMLLYKNVNINSDYFYLFINLEMDMNMCSFGRFRDNQELFDELIYNFIISTICPDEKMDCRKKVIESNKLELIKKANPLFFLDGLA